MMTHGYAPNALAGDSPQSGNTNEKSLIASGVDYLAQGFKLQIFYNTENPGRQAAAQILKQNLESLSPGNILITVTGIDYAQYQQMQTTGQMPVFFNGWAPDFADPQDYTEPFYRSGAILAARLGYSNTTLDAKIDAAAAQMDPTLRALQYKEISMDMYKEAVYIWTSQLTSFYAGGSWLSGYYFNPMYSNLYYCALEKNKSYPGVKNPDTFIYGEFPGDPQSLDPARDYETTGGEVLQNVFETLIWYNGSSPNDLVPMLSLNVPTLADKNLSEDGMQYTYHIRQGVKFHSNDTLTANDVAFSLERALRLNDRNSPVWILGEIMIPNFYSYPSGTFDVGTGALVGGVNDDAALENAIWVKDMYTIQINLTRPAPYFNAAMAYTVGSVVSKNDTMAHGGLTKSGYDWVNSTLIGTGPYQFTGFNSGQNITLQRWDGYWSTPAQIKNVVLQQIADDNSRTLQLKNGDLDAAAIPKSQVASVLDVTGIDVISGSPTFTISYMALNQNINLTGLDTELNTIPADFFQDRDVRQAFAHAFDCPTFLQTYYNGSALQPNGAIPKGMFGYSADVPVYDFNLTRSTELLGGQSGNESDFTYTTSGSPAVATITGYTGAGGAVTIPSTLGGFPTNSIGAQAFYSLSSLTSVTIPDGLTSIGSYAFGSCDYLTSVSMGNSITDIGPGAFQHCSSLTSVIIPDSVTSMASQAFSWCLSLASVTIGDNLPFIDPQVFQNCVSLTSVTIPSKVTGIGTLAFESCTSLTSVTIPGSVTSIGYAAFSSCALASVTLPSGIVSIGEHAFSSNPLTSITFLGLVAPMSVGVAWIQGADAGIRGHAYAASNFPAPGGVWNGLTMGDVLPPPPATAPTAPQNLVASGSVGEVTLTWKAPASDGGSPLTGYKVYYGTTDHPNGTFVSVGPTSTSAMIGGLDTGRVYYFNVIAMNAVGNSTISPDLVILVPASGQHVPSVSSTSNLSGYDFNASKNELTFSVSGAVGTTGQARIFVPSSLVGNPSKMTVKFDGQAISYKRSSVSGGWTLDITYAHSNHTVVVSFGALPSDDGTTPTLLIGFSVVAVVIVAAVFLIVFKPKKKR